jgi:hypothetical protein
VTASECGSSSRTPLERGLADELADHHLLGLVGELALGVEHRTLGQPGDEQVGEQRDLEVGHRAGGHDLGPVPELRDGEQLLADLLLGDLVALGDHRDDGGLQLLQLRGDEAGRPGRSCRRR